LQTRIARDSKVIVARIP